MNEIPVPDVACEQHHPVLPVSDVTEAVAYYTETLGFSFGFSWGEPPALAGVNLGDVSVHLSAADGERDGVDVVFVIDDADALFEYQRAKGARTVAEPEDKPWGLRAYAVLDPYGNVLTFAHRLPQAAPLEIERVDVVVRLERRLAALLEALAVHKNMSLSECVEETLLHSIERDGDGIASPHSKRTLDVIDKLKAAHGIDYDAHAGYGFVERQDT